MVHRKSKAHYKIFPSIIYQNNLSKAPLVNLWCLQGHIRVWCRGTFKIKGQLSHKEYNLFRKKVVSLLWLWRDFCQVQESSFQYSSNISVAFLPTICYGQYGAGTVYQKGLLHCGKCRILIFWSLNYAEKLLDILASSAYILHRLFYLDLMSPDQTIATQDRN